MEKLLLHSCCGPCAVVPILRLKDSYDLYLYFANSNVNTKEEFEKRLDALLSICAKTGVSDKKLIVERYNNNNFKEITQGLEREKEGGARCEKCFDMRLIQTAKKASEMGINKFATSLTLSPHKNAKIINGIGQRAALSFKISYLDSDFKKQDGYKQSILLCKQWEIYRQNYCGCTEIPKELPPI